MGKCPGIRWLELLGDASYAIYLGQAFTLPVVRIAWSKLDLPLSSTVHLIGFYGAAVVVTLIGGVMIHLLIEKPVSRWLTPARVPHRREVPVSAP